MQKREAKSLWDDITGAQLFDVQGMPLIATGPKDLNAAVEALVPGHTCPKSKEWSQWNVERAGAHLGTMADVRQRWHNAKYRAERNRRIAFPAAYGPANEDDDKDEDEDDEDYEYDIGPVAPQQPLPVATLPAHLPLPSMQPSTAPSNLPAPVPAFAPTHQHIPEDPDHVQYGMQTVANLWYPELSDVHRSRLPQDPIQALTSFTGYRSDQEFTDVMEGNGALRKAEVIWYESTWNELPPDLQNMRPYEAFADILTNYKNPVSWFS